MECIHFSLIELDLKRVWWLGSSPSYQGGNLTPCHPLMMAKGTWAASIFPTIARGKTLSIYHVVLIKCKLC